MYFVAVVVSSGGGDGEERETQNQSQREQWTRRDTTPARFWAAVQENVRPRQHLWADGCDYQVFVCLRLLPRGDQVLSKEGAVCQQQHHHPSWGGGAAHTGQPRIPTNHRVLCKVYTSRRQIFSLLLRLNQKMWKRKTWLYKVWRHSSTKNGRKGHKRVPAHNSRCEKWQLRKLWNVQRLQQPRAHM